MSRMVAAGCVVTMAETSKHLPAMIHLIPSTSTLRVKGRRFCQPILMKGYENGFNKVTQMNEWTSKL